MREGRICQICKKWFMPNKYRPNQEVCSNLECQYQRQLNNMKQWRHQNPEYFKYREKQDESWRETCRERARKWREKHKDYLKLYRQEFKEHHRIYMRMYMREYRKRKAADKAGTLENKPDQTIKSADRQNKTDQGSRENQ